ncbi:MAG: serine/threonine protein kinase [Thaumarchaeota archaeon]|nr:serine/threonine protein kinase [Nitrososphaerota archaeon]GFN40783.1 MAG: serine/threonine protein kinase [Marine Group I thaumarchaeote]
MTRQTFLPIRKLTEQPYSNILGFPKANKKQLQSRIKELQKLKIKGVCFEGATLIGKLHVLGKGYVGIVVLAKQNQKKVAIKIRRTDSQRDGMINEAKLLELANKAKAGPKVIKSSKNFLVMEYLDGKKIFDWIKQLKGKGSATKLKKTIRKVLEDCYKLDRLGLDHGELSNISKHVIVGKKATLIDFESSSTNRRISNVTAASQAIFIGSGISKIVKKIYKIPPQGKIIEVLRTYKNEQTRKSFDNVLQVLRL